MHSVTWSEYARVLTRLSPVHSVGGIGGVVAQNLQIAGHTWNLHHGPNANWDVFSFITAEGDITDFKADINKFFRTVSHSVPVVVAVDVLCCRVSGEQARCCEDAVHTSHPSRDRTFYGDRRPCHHQLQRRRLHVSAAAASTTTVILVHNECNDFFTYSHSNSEHSLVG